MSDKVLTRLRNWISTSGLSEGARIPPERELCTTLGVSRAELRKALLVLEAEGAVDRGAGRGTFLTRPPNQPASGGLAQTIAALSETSSPIDAMQARLALEPEIARRAALHATPGQLRELRRLSGEMRKAPTWAAYEDLDGAFHQVIAEATGNTLLSTLHRILNQVRLVVVWRRLDTSATGPDDAYHSFAEHDAILTALEARDAGAAAAAMAAHLQATLRLMTLDL